MRKLAAELGVTPGALYRHLSGQSELIALMIDDIMERVEMPDSEVESDPWQRIRIHVRSVNKVLNGYPGVDRLVARNADSSASARRRQRWLVDQLRAGGLSRPDAVKAYGALETYWLGSRHRNALSPATFYFGLDRMIEGFVMRARSDANESRSFAR
jgi:AcrR family transcriptional regulator